MMRVTVAFSPAAGIVDLCEVELGTVSSVADAIGASGLAGRHPQIDLSTLRTGLWGAPCARDQVLRDGDRVELYRPLRVDPKEARRERSQAHRERMKALDQRKRERAPKPR